MPKRSAGVLIAAKDDASAHIARHTRVIGTCCPSVAPVALLFDGNIACSGSCYQPLMNTIHSWSYHVAPFQISNHD